MTIWKVVPYLLLAALTASPVPSSASSCIRPKAVAIHFERGASCWTYYGDATKFTGRFDAGQMVVATSSGMAGFADGKSDWRAVLPRTVYVGDNSGFYVTMDTWAAKPTRLPNSGLYTFDFSPCSMWHGVGQFVICAH